MPNPIKAFFEKKKAEAKFKLAGPGQKLGDAAAAQQSAAARHREAEAVAQMRQRAAAAGSSRGAAPTAAQQQAAQAALARFNNAPTPSDDFEKKRSQAVIRAQAQKELDEQKKVEGDIARLRDTYKEKPVIELEASPICPGIFFCCPLIGPEVLPKEQMKIKIKQFLYEQLEEEKGLTACLIIHTMAKDSETAKVCVSTICKYIDNILENPNDDKFRKIRKSNKAYVERVAICEGHDFFLEAVGFESEKIDDQDFWNFPGEIIPEQLEVIRTLRDALVSSEPIRAELDRGMKVLLPQQASRKFELPQDYYSLNAEEIRREIQAKAELVEREGMLRTKAMREREEQKERRRYRYTLIRVRFPDGLVLQGTFSVYERYRLLHDFVSECLEIPLPFVLYETGHRLEVSDYDTTLGDLRLAPSAILTFAWHPEVAEEVAQQMGPKPVFLKEEVRALMSTE